MMCLRSHFPTRFSLPFSSPKPSLLSFKPPRFSAAAMSPTVEHIVLFKVKDDTDSSKIAAMVNSLNGLIPLTPSSASPPGLYSATAQPPPPPPSPSLTCSTADTDPRKTWPRTLRALPTLASSGTLSSPSATTSWPSTGSPPPGSVLRVSFLKLKEGLIEEARSEVLATVNGVGDGLGQGENISPARAKGFSIASLAVFDGPADLEAMESSKEFINSQKDKVSDYLESVIVV